MSCKEKNNCDVIEEIKCRGKDKPINIPFVLPPGPPGPQGPAGDPAAITMTPLAGGTSSVSANLIITQIS